jgi:hypothetical protein
MMSTLIQKSNQFCRIGSRTGNVKKNRVLCLVILTIWMILLSACGKKGPPVPQTFVPPPVVKGLQIILEDNIATLRWPIPEWEEKGEDFLAGFHVYRSQTAAEKSCEDCPVRFKKVADIQIKNNTSAGSYTEPLETGFQYSFKVSGYTDSGYEGEKSETVTIDF